MAVKRNVFRTAGMKSVGAFHSFLGGFLGVGASPLSQSSKLVAIGRVTRLGQVGVMRQFAIL